MKIVIEGQRNEGKTTISAIVEKALRGVGYNVEVREGPTPGGPLSHVAQKHMAEVRAQVQADVQRATPDKGRRIVVLVNNLDDHHFVPALDAIAAERGPVRQMGGPERWPGERDGELPRFRNWHEGARLPADPQTMPKDRELQTITPAEVGNLSDVLGNLNEGDQPAGKVDKDCG